MCKKFMINEITKIIFKTEKLLFFEILLPQFSFVFYQHTYTVI